MTRIFLDDERYPVTDDFVICRNIFEFSNTLLTSEQVNFVSFDHDLGDSPNGFQCAKMLVEYDMDYGILSDDFRFYVHSQNPVGAENIRSLLDSYLAMKSND